MCPVHHTVSVCVGVGMGWSCVCVLYGSELWDSIIYYVMRRRVGIDSVLTVMFSTHALSPTSVHSVDCTASPLIVSQICKPKVHDVLYSKKLY